MKKATAKKQKIRSLVGRRYFAATGVHRCGPPPQKKTIMKELAIMIGVLKNS